LPLSFSLSLSPFLLILSLTGSFRRRLNGRLPQTPRSPHTAAAHYFDDIFSRSARPHPRRSSTSRSIGNRSDFATSIHGDGDSIAPLDEDEHDDLSAIDSARAELADGVRVYAADQLRRLRSQASFGVYEDEFEAQLDETPKGD
jgi:hypothetical protein